LRESPAGSKDSTAAAATPSGGGPTLSFYALALVGRPWFSLKHLKPTRLRFIFAASYYSVTALCLFVLNLNGAGLLLVTYKVSFKIFGYGSFQSLPDFLTFKIA